MKNNARLFLEPASSVTSKDTVTFNPSVMCRAFVGRAVVVSRAKLRFSSVVYLINIDVGSSYNSFGAFYPALISAGAKWHVKLALRHRIKARDNVDARGRQWSRIFFFPAPRRRDFRRNPSFFFFYPCILFFLCRFRLFLFYLLSPYCQIWFIIHK